MDLIMERELLKFGGGVAESVVNPVVFALVIIAGLLICILPRNKAIFPFITAAMLIPMDQVLVIGPFHFPMLRLLILFGAIRLCWTKLNSQAPLFSGGMNKADKVIMTLTLVTALDWILLWGQVATVIYQFGEIYTVFGTYFLLRFLIRDREDVERLLRGFIYVTVVLAILMTIEQVKGWNPYSILGGANASFFSAGLMRGDRFRSTGPFGHPILAGTFGSVMAPLYVGLWWSTRRQRAIAILGVLAATAMVMTSNSSTPILALIAGTLALSLWKLRGWLRVMRWSLVIILVSLHMVMKAPVWNLIARIDVVGGSSADHRYQLVNQCILHFKDWWLIGVKYNGQWGWDMWDTANQYVSLAQSSGVVPLALFILLIIYGFKLAGRARVMARSRRDALMYWSFGSALFAHTVGYFGISYFDQTIVAWYALFAVLAVAYSDTRASCAAARSSQRGGDESVRDKGVRDSEFVVEGEVATRL
jgi:hypothetical protein